jgi:hypothetical protein
VPTALQTEMNSIKESHRVTPLPVYRDDQFVEAPNVTSVLTNALAEVHFRIKHYRINRQEGAHDSYSALVEQVVVLKDGIPKPVNAYKRKNVREGPFRPKPAPNLPSKSVSVVDGQANGQKEVNHSVLDDIKDPKDGEEGSNTGKDMEVDGDVGTSSNAKGKMVLRGTGRASKM